MRVAQILLIISVLLVLVAGGWYAMQSSETSPGGGQALTREIGPGPEDPSHRGELPRGSVSLEQRFEPEPREAQPDELASATGAAAEASARRQRTVSGRVIDEFGTGISGARVFIARRAAFGTENIDLVPQDHSFIKVESAETDSAGNFSFASSLRGELRFAVRCAGYAPLRVSRAVEGGDEARAGDLVLERGALLRGHVVDGDGNGVQGVAIASIDVSSGSGFSITFMGASSHALAVTGPGGTFEIDELAAGPFELVLHSDDHPDSRVTGNVERPGQALGNVRYVLDDGHGISGRVLGLAAGQAQELSVRAIPNGGLDFDDPQASGAVRLAVIASDGTFELRGLREGSYRLSLIEPSSDPAMLAAAQSLAVMAEAGDQGVELELNPPRGLTFRVLDDASGEPLTEYRAAVGRFRPQPLRGGAGASASEHPDGRATFEDVPLEGGQTNTSLRLSSDGYESLSITDIRLTPGVVFDLGDVRLKPVPMITVLVLDDQSGEPIKRARVILSEVGPQSSSGGSQIGVSIGGHDDHGSEMPEFLTQESNRARTDEHGIAEVPSMPGKLCTLSVRHRGYAEHEGEAIRLPQSGPREFEIRLLKGGTVIVYVQDALGQVLSDVRVEQTFVEDADDELVIFAGGNAPKSNSKGVVRFTNLRAGTHSFKLKKSSSPMFAAGNARVVIGGPGAAGSGDGGQEVLVSEGSVTEITLRAQPQGEIRGRVTERGQPLAGASISIDDKSGGERGGFPDLASQFGGESVRTDSQGKFSRKDLEVGEYTLTVTHPTRSMPDTFDLTVNEGSSTENYDLPVAIIEGRVLDSQGAAAVGVEVTPKRLGDTPGQGAGAVSVNVIMTSEGGGGMAVSFGDETGDATRTDAQGRYSLRGVTPDVELIVETSADGFQKARSEPVVVGPDQTRDNVDIEVFEAGRVTVIAIDSSGSPMPFILAKLEFVGEAESRPDPGRGFTGEGGRATIDSLKPGPWMVSARTMDMIPGAGESEQGVAEPVQVEVTAGENVEVTLQFD